MALRILHRICTLPKGYSKVRYLGSIYGVTRTDFNRGKSIKLYARDLADTNFISCNYCSGIKNPLKPCEMPAEEVLHFIENYEFTTADNG